MSEIRWAWRNIVARRWRAVLTIGLLAVALAATTIVFSAADSLVFRRVAYPSADRLVTFDTRDAKSGRPGGGFASAAVLDEWRKQTDLFAGVHGHLYKTIFLLGNGEPELVPAADVTPGLIDMLGVWPRWGRTLLESDTHRTDVHVVLIAEEIARERFGDPARSVDQRIETTAEPLLVVGVMPASFRFPDGTQRVWRAFDPRGPLARNMGISLIARVADGVSLTQLTQMMEARSEALYFAAGARNVLIASPAPLRTARVIAEQRRLLFVLLGAAISLLLTACANVASLELASALTRARTYAIQLAIGASRAALVRAGLLEGNLLVGTAGLAAFVLAYVATDALGRYLPVALTASVNPIDIDYRPLAVTIGLGVVKHVRTTYDGTAGPERHFQKYSLRQPPPPVTASTASTPRSSGAAYGFLTVTARVDSRLRASDLYQTVRSIDARNILKVEFVDDQYARQFAERLLATRIMTGFGMLAFVVAAAGIYGVMAFLVANRAREIGIRMALGADTRRIRSLVLASSMWLVLLGAGIGIAGAFVASRWAQSQLFGVKATDPLTIVLVTVAVALTALLATWHPARQATRVDPKVLLRN